MKDCCIVWDTCTCWRGFKVDQWWHYCTLSTRFGHLVKSLGFEYRLSYCVSYLVDEHWYIPSLFQCSPHQLGGGTRWEWLWWNLRMTMPGYEWLCSGLTTGFIYCMLLYYVCTIHACTCVAQVNRYVCTANLKFQARLLLCTCRISNMLTEVSCKRQVLLLCSEIVDCPE